jgi:hypothetical protein
MAKIPDFPLELWNEVVSPLSESEQAFFKKGSWAAIVTSDFAN